MILCCNGANKWAIKVEIEADGRSKSYKWVIKVQIRNMVEFYGARDHKSAVGAQAGAGHVVFPLGAHNMS